MNNLVIIGNGFDLHHKLPTSFNDFRNFLSLNNQQIQYQGNPELLRLLDSYFYFNENWSDFEEKLCSFDLNDFIIEEGVDLVDDDNDEHPMRNQAIIEDSCTEKIKMLREDIPSEINEWINNIPYDAIDKQQLVKLFDKNDLFISFNYSCTLEKIYKINPTNIVHLHGFAKEHYNEGEIIVGHGTKKPIIPKYKGKSNTLSDLFAADVYEDNKKIFQDLYKDPSKHIPKLEPIIEQIRLCRKIIILGHSLSSVDAEYFRFIARTIPSQTTIHVYYHNTSDLAKMKTAAEDFFPQHRKKFILW